ncbi:MAG: hypothetical protein AAFQ82_12760, partial [Myxococcota bacterium]
MKRTLLTVALCVGIIAGGFVVAGGIAALKPEVNRNAGTAQPTAVVISDLEPARTQLRVQASGTVEPAQSVNVVPEVSGRITWRSKTLVPGGRIK